MARKFYYYRLWVEDQDGEEVSLIDLVDEDELKDGHMEEPVSEDDSKKYYIGINDINREGLHGIILRMKDDSEYVRRVGNNGSLKSLDEFVDDEGETGDSRSGFADIAMVVNDEANLLIEVGYQTPGINIVRKFFEKLIDNEDYEVKKEVRHERAIEQKLDNLKGKDLKKMTISLKNNPSDYDDDMWNQFKHLTSDYRLKFSISLERGSNASTVQDKILDVLGNDDEEEDALIESLTQMDLPRLLYSFKIEAVEEEDQEVEENLADITDKEKIDDERYSVNDKELGEELCQKIQRRFG